MKAAIFLAATLLSGLSLAAPDEELLGKRDGYAVCKHVVTPGGLDQRCYVGNLSHYDEIVPARKVAKGAAVRPLKRAEKEPRLHYEYQGRLGDVDSFLNANRNTGLLVLHGDTILVERYQYERKPEHRFQSYSMAKTVVAMLIGIALEEKKIGSIDDLAQQYVPELKGRPYGETKLRDLLTMSSGVKGADDTPEAGVLFRKTLFGQGGVDAVMHFEERVAPAGAKFTYASAETQVLSLVLRAAIARPLADYLAAKIWQPMGAEADATWNVDGGGHELGYMGINATLRDWGRLGLLLANDGALDGQQIVPAAWVRAMTTPDAPHLRMGYEGKRLGYGYQTWLIHPTERQFRLWGVRGQGIYVDAQTRLVVVHTAVAAQPRDTMPEQYFFFRGVLNSLKTL